MSEFFFRLSSVDEIQPYTRGPLPRRSIRGGSLNPSRRILPQAASPFRTRASLITLLELRCLRTAHQSIGHVSPKVRLQLCKELISAPLSPQHNSFRGLHLQPAPARSTTIFDPKISAPRRLLTTAWLIVAQLSRTFYLLALNSATIRADHGHFLERVHKNLEMISWKPSGNNFPR